MQKERGQFLGWFSFQPKDAAHPGEVTLGYRLCRAIWGQGYATEGVGALIRKGFTQLGVQRVLATTYQDNLASRRVMEKAGLRLVRMIGYTREDFSAEYPWLSMSGDLWDGNDLEYALLKADWQRQEGRENP